MKIPLSKKLKKRAHLELALLQDEVMEVFYSISMENEPVLHGGTAIWRCYNGSRFSEDLDFYGAPEEEFKEKLEDALHSRGLTLRKYKKAPHVIFAKISNEAVEVKLEISTGTPKKRVNVTYEKTDGTTMEAYSISREELIEEKMNAYLGRKFIRDIYDVYFLGKQLGKVADLKKFLDALPAPVDERNLRTLIYSGISPSFKEMVEALRRLV